MSNEIKIALDYLKAVIRYWWIVAVGLGLTIMDFVERIFATWYQPPLWARVSAAVAGLMIANYLAFRDVRLQLLAMAKSKGKDEVLAAALEAGRGLQWEASYRPATTSQEFSQWASQVDDWIRATRDMLLANFGKLAVETFLNDAGLKDVSYPGIPSEYHLRLTFLNRRLENLHRIAQSAAN